VIVVDSSEATPTESLQIQPKNMKNNMMHLILLLIIYIDISMAWLITPSLNNNGILSSHTSLNLAVQDKISGLGKGLGLQWDEDSSEKIKSSENNINGNNINDRGEKQGIPFIIQKIGRGTKSEIEEITDMCIDVFFNEEKKTDTNNGEVSSNKKKRVKPWKALQLAYLGNMQRGDILARNAFKPEQKVDLIVARRVYPVDTARIVDLIDDNNRQTSSNIISDKSQIYNIDQSKKIMYVTGEVIGYVEVMEKQFGLGGNFNNEKPKPIINNRKKKKKQSGEKPRPYLGNLSVVDYARKSGVGSRLVQTCEEVVMNWNRGHTEIVLQVEDDNKSAIQFYKRRGYEFVYADPTCRRFDTSGFILKETRVTKYAMLKRLPVANRSKDEEANDIGQKLKGFFFAQ